MQRLRSALMVAACCLTGCTDNDWKWGQEPDRSMVYSSGQFARGYRDGMREAEQSWFEDHAGWAWLWVMDEEYRKGYEKGWNDGRSTVHMREKQDQASDKTPRAPE